MAHEGVKHDYHLVNPSPWPLLGSFAAFVLTASGVTWMHGLFGVPKEQVGSMWVLLPGVALVIITMIVWWRDVTIEANTGDHTPGEMSGNEVYDVDPPDAPIDVGVPSPGGVGFLSWLAVVP